MSDGSWDKNDPKFKKDRHTDVERSSFCDHGTPEQQMGVIGEIENIYTKITSIEFESSWEKVEKILADSPYNAIVPIEELEYVLNFILQGHARENEEVFIDKVAFEHALDGHVENVVVGTIRRLAIAKSKGNLRIDAQNHTIEINGRIFREVPRFCISTERKTIGGVERPAYAEIGINAQTIDKKLLGKMIFQMARDYSVNAAILTAICANMQPLEIRAVFSEGRIKELRENGQKNPLSFLDVEILHWINKKLVKSVTSGGLSFNLDDYYAAEKYLNEVNPEQKSNKSVQRLFRVGKHGTYEKIPKMILQGLPEIILRHGTPDFESNKLYNFAFSGNNPKYICTRPLTIYTAMVRITDPKRQREGYVSPTLYNYEKILGFVEQ